MHIELSDLAALKLRLLILEEKSEHPLAVRVIPLTSGCSTPSFALELTEVLPSYESTMVKELLFAWLPEEREWMNGIVIDINRENGKFIIFHPNPPFMSNCQLGSNL